MKPVLGLFLLVTLCQGGSIRVARDACEELFKEFDDCAAKAYEEYKVAFQNGDDGRPDWMARKSCNYMTAAVEVCGNMLMKDGCNTQEEVDEMKDHQMEGILHQLQQSVEEWDTDKCPVVKAHVERKNPPAEVEAAAQEEEEDDNNNEEEGDNQDETKDTEGEDDAEENNEEDGGEEDKEDGDQGEGDNPEENEKENNPEEPEDGDNQEENEDGENSKETEDGENPEETDDGDKPEDNEGNGDEEDGGNGEGKNGEEENGDSDPDDDDIKDKIGAAPSLAASIAVMTSLLMICIA